MHPAIRYVVNILTALCAVAAFLVLFSFASRFVFELFVPGNSGIMYTSEGIIVPVYGFAFINSCHITFLAIWIFGFPLWSDFREFLVRCFTFTGAIAVVTATFVSFGLLYRQSMKGESVVFASDLPVCSTSLGIFAASIAVASIRRVRRITAEKQRMAQQDEAGRDKR